MSHTNYIYIINNDKKRRDMVVGKVVAQLCLTLIIKELKFIFSVVWPATSSHVWITISGGAMYIMFENHVRS
jgi:hypothetical protein